MLTDYENMMIKLYDERNKLDDVRMKKSINSGHFSRVLAYYNIFFINSLSIGNKYSYINNNSKKIESCWIDKS